VAYTDIDTIKKILQAMPKIFANIKNEEIVFTAFDKQDLQYSNIDDTTEIVKIIRVATPSQDQVTLNDTTEADLTGTFIVPNTVVVASDLTLTTHYIENKDYIIDYDSGKISRASVGGSIPNGASVYVWYLPFVQLTSSSDYNIDNDEGTLTRRAGTSIPNGATTYVDYSHSQGNVPDDMIQESIDETENFFSTIIKSEYLTSTDETLKSASTNHCMYLICLSMAQRDLKIGKKTGSNLANEWMKLSDDYFTTYERFIGKFVEFSAFNAGDKRINKNSTFANLPNKTSLTPATKR